MSFDLPYKTNTTTYKQLNDRLVQDSVQNQFNVYINYTAKFQYRCHILAYR